VAERDNSIDSNNRLDKMNTKLNQQIGIMLRERGIDQEGKEEMVHEFTDGRTKSIRGMNDLEKRELIRLLRGSVQMPTPPNDINNQKRRRIISHLKEAGYVLPDGKADMQAIQAWVAKQRFKKELNAHSSAELSVLISCAEKVREHYYLKIK